MTKENELKSVLDLEGSTFTLPDGRIFDIKPIIPPLQQKPVEIGDCFRLELPDGTRIELSVYAILKDEQ